MQNIICNESRKLLTFGAHFLCQNYLNQTKLLLSINSNRLFHEILGAKWQIMTRKFDYLIILFDSHSLQHFDARYHTYSAEINETTI